MTVVKTSVDQEAAALGAAALAAVGTGVWPDFGRIDQLHHIERVSHPIPQNVAIYEQLLPIFIKAAHYQAELGDMLAGLNI